MPRRGPRTKHAAPRSEELNFASNGPVLPTAANGDYSGLPNGWHTRRLGELLREVDVRQADLSKAEAEELEVLSLTRNNGLILQSERFGKRIATEDTSKYKVVREGQVVYNPYVIWEGAVHALRKYQAGLVSPVYPVWETREPDGGFVDYLLRTPPLIEAYNRVCSGAVNRRRSIREAAFTAITVAVPEVRERQAIASVLRTVQRAKESCEQVLASTRQLKQSLLHHLFTYGPVPFAQAAHVSLKETEIGPIPEHWSVVSIRDIETFMQYGTSSRCEARGSGLPVLRIPNVVGGRIDTADLKYLAASPTEIERHLLQRGDLLFVRTNGVRENVGRCAIYLGSPARSLFASYLIRARLASDRALPEFVQLFTETNTGRASFTGRASGAADGKFNINTQTIRSTILPLPPLPEQREIVTQLAAVDARMAAEESRRAALAALFQSLLHHLMTGRLRLPGFQEGLDHAAANRNLLSVA